MLPAAGHELAGVHIALPTPFTLDGALDLDAFNALCADVLSAAPTSIVIGSPLSERSVLEITERRLLAASAAANAAERARASTAHPSTGPLVLVDVSTTDWRRSGLLAADAAETGADAVLLSAPSDHRPSQRELADHVRSVAAHGLPVILVNDPAVTRMTLDVAHVLELARLDGVVGVVDVADTQVLLAGLHHSDPSLPLLVGRDEHVLTGHGAGASGWLTTFGCVVPSLVQELWRAVDAHTPEDAPPTMFTRLEPLLRSTGRASGVSAVKLLLDLLDRSGGGLPRPPRRALEGAERDAIIRELPELRRQLQEGRR
jgi:4-hydroxy-tetrahydrodipicolinate synthase